MKKKRILSLLMVLTLFISLLPHAAAVSARDFTDISEDDWCFEYVDYVTSQGYFLGTTDTTFSPNRSMTRAMFVVVLSRYDGARVNNSQSAFTDVEPGAWCAGAINWAAANGIVGGYEDGTFRPDQPVTRAQMCAIMDRYVEYYCDEHDVTVAAKGSVSTLADQSQIPSYAVGSVRDCQRWGLINGYADGTFRPQAESSRAHVAAVIYRLAFLLDDAEPNKPDRPSHSGGGSSGGSDDPSYTYRLTYDANGGKFSNGETSVTDVKSSSSSRSCRFTVTYMVPARDGYTFQGWATSPTAASAEYTSGLTYTVDSDRADTLYAVWEEDSQVEDEDLIGKAVEEAVALANNRLDEIMGTLNDAINEVIPDSDDAAALEAAVRDVISIGKVNFNADTRTVSANVSLDISQLSRDEGQAVVDAVTNLISSLLSTEEGSLSGQDVKVFLTAIKNQIEAITGINIDETSWEEIKSYVMSHLKEEGANLWVPFHQNTGAYVTGNVAIATPEDSDNHYSVGVIVDDVNDTTTLDGVNKATAVKEMTLAIAKNMFADLKDLSAGRYISEAELTGTAHVTFSEPADEDLAAQTNNYPYDYDVSLVVDLNSRGFVSYKFDDSNSTVSANYFKVTVTKGLQDAYNDALDVIAADFTNDSEAQAQVVEEVRKQLAEKAGTFIQEIKTSLQNYGITEDMLTIDEEALVQALSDVVDDWISANWTTIVSNYDDEEFTLADLDNEKLIEAAWNEVKKALPQDTAEMAEWADAMLESQIADIDLIDRVQNNESAQLLAGMLGVDISTLDGINQLLEVEIAYGGQILSGENVVYTLAKEEFDAKFQQSATFQALYEHLTDDTKDYLIYAALEMKGLNMAPDAALAESGLQDLMNLLKDADGPLMDILEERLNGKLAEIGVKEYVEDFLAGNEEAQDKIALLETLKFPEVCDETFQGLANALRGETVADIIGNRGDSFVADTLSVYLTKLMGVIPDGASITVNGEELKGEDLGAFADADTTADLLDALADLCERDAFKGLSINSFAEDQDAGLTGIPVTVQYNSRTFNFNFVIEV